MQHVISYTIFFPSLGVLQENQAAPPAQASQEMPRWILRKTFLDIEDGTDYLDDVPKRRARSAGLLPLVQWA